MIRIIDTSNKIDSLFVESKFDLSVWEAYINSIYENCAHYFTDDMNECIGTGKYTFEHDFLPIINAVYNNSKLSQLYKNFNEATNKLNEKVVERFGKELDVDIVLYLGLSNGAGWVMTINDRNTVMLGIEKIIELDWVDRVSMCGLIYHELGHIYQLQYGTLEQESPNNDKNFVWQLFTEGIAMYFEQELVGDKNFYHQDKNGWKLWCDGHFEQILADFNTDLPEMSYSNQRYFGDWANYFGYGDVGYYLGARFVRYLLKNCEFGDIINFDINNIYERYIEFTKETLQ